MTVVGIELGLGVLLLVVLAGWLGGVAQSSLGFGAAFATVPALALAAPELLPGSMLVAIIPLSLAMLARERARVDLGAVARLTLGRLPGIISGALIVAVLPTRGLVLVIALLLLAAVVASGAGWQVAVTGPRELTAGFVSGLTGTAAALGGPPLALLYRGRDGASMRPTLAAVWAVGTIPALGSLTVVGEFTAQQAQAGLLLSITLLLGLVGGAALVRRVPDQRLRRGVLWWAGIGGLLALARALLG